MIIIEKQIIIRTTNYVNLVSYRQAFVLSKLWNYQAALIDSHTVTLSY